MELAIQPPQAYLPRRNDTLSFTANSPPLYNPAAGRIPGDTDSGRDNNQGFEGLTISPDGKTLYILIQSSFDQEYGPKKQNRAPARQLAYDISGKVPRYIHEWVVMLPSTTTTPPLTRVELTRSPSSLCIGMSMFSLC